MRYLSPSECGKIAALRARAQMYWATAQRCWDLANGIESGRPIEYIDHFGIARSVVAKECGIDEIRLSSKRRPQHVAAARQILAYVMRMQTGASLPQIGVMMGRDHSTVHYSCQIIAKRYESEPEFAKTIDRIVRTIKKRLADATKEEAQTRAEGELELRPTIGAEANGARPAEPQGILRSLVHDNDGTAAGE